MAEPPFQMPGHRWDPEKKRFFKILPGQPASSASKRSTFSTRAGSSDSSSRFDRKRNERGLPAEQHFATTPRLPALQLFHPAQKTRVQQSRFVRQVSDPVTARQQGRMPVAVHQHSEQRRIEAAYSQLVLCDVSTPSAGGWHSPKIIAMQIDADGQSLLLLDAVAMITRFSPSARLSHLVFSRVSEPGPSFMVMGSGALWHGSSASDGSQQTVWCMPLQHQHQGNRSESGGAVQAVSLPPHLSATEFMESSPLSSQRVCIRYDTLLRSQGPTSWAMREAVLPQGGEVVNPVEGSKVLYFAVSALKVVQVYVIDSPPRAPGFHQRPKLYDSVGSDITATTFDLSGEVLYCGTRSGLVLAWRWRDDAPFRSRGQKHVSTLFKGQGSVTNLQAVSSNEIVVVRINGHVELVDTTDGQVKQRFQGHVNTYDFNLGFALDAELRLLALAGLDRKVRVWSLSSPFPLGTSTSTLPHSYHAQTNLQDQDQGEARDSLPSTALSDRSSVSNFARGHAALNGNPSTTRGSTLGSVSFPADVTALHWHPRFAYEGCDPYEVHVLHQVQGASFCQPQHQWKDLFVAAGKHLYHFRWP